MNIKTTLGLGLLLALAFVPQASAMKNVYIWDNATKYLTADLEEYGEWASNTVNHQVGYVGELPGYAVDTASGAVDSVGPTIETAGGATDGWVDYVNGPVMNDVNDVVEGAPGFVLDTTTEVLSNAPSDPCDENPDDCDINCSGQPGPCSCDDPNPPVTCAHDCTQEQYSNECHAVYCQSHPDYSSCNGEAIKCKDGYYGWNTDGDPECDKDDLDDDNDGVPDKDDCDPSYNDPVVGQVDSVLYSLGVQC